MYGSFVAVHCFVVFGSRYHPFFSDCSGRGFISRAFSVPSVLVLGSSFIRRLRDDLRSHFDSRADDTFGLSDDANVHLHGVAGLTEFNSRGSPRRAANRRKFRMKASAVKSGTVSRCTALEIAQVCTETQFLRISPFSFT